MILRSEYVAIFSGWQIITYICVQVLFNNNEMAWVYTLAENNMEPPVQNGRHLVDISKRMN